MINCIKEYFLPEQKDWNGNRLTIIRTIYRLNHINIFRSGEKNCQYD